MLKSADNLWKDYQENENNCEWKNRQNLVDKFGVKLKTFQFQIMQR